MHLLNPMAKKRGVVKKMGGRQNEGGSPKRGGTTLLLFYVLKNLAALLGKVSTCRVLSLYILYRTFYKIIYPWQDLNKKTIEELE